MTKKDLLTAVPEHKNTIDGQAVIAREVARLYVPLAITEDQLVETRGVHKCLLEDGREVYQCVHLNELECTYWHVNGISVRSHLRSHSDRMMARRLSAENAKLEAERDALEDEAAQQRERYSNGAKLGWEKRRAAAQAAEAAGGEVPGISISEVRQELNVLATTVEQMAEDFAKVGTIVTNMASSFKGVKTRIDEIAAMDIVEPTPDPKLVARADAWANLRELLNKTN